MVRIKHRYLLINIFYPDLPPQPFPSGTSTATTPPYLIFHRPTSRNVTPSSLLHALRTTITTLFGDCGLGLTTASLKIIYFSHATSTLILRAPRAAYRLVWAGLTYIREIRTGKKGGMGGEGEEWKGVMRVVRVSGTIRKVQEEVVRRGRREVVRARAEGVDVVLGRENKMAVEVERGSGDDGVEEEAEISEDEDEDE